MDLASLIANKPLLASLAREYELLKANTADINYEEWIVKRLKIEAAQQSSSRQGAAAAVPHAANAQQTNLSPGTASTQHQIHAEQPNPQAAAGDALSIKLQALARRNRTGKRATSVYDRDGALLLADEQPADQLHVVSPILQGWQAQGTTNTQHTVLQAQADYGSRGPAPLLKQPETSQHTLNRIHSSNNPPSWVAAAKLQSSLQPSSAVVPLMHAAAERDRRLAATAALVRLQLATSSSATSGATDAIVQQHALLAQRYGSDSAANQQEQQQQQQLLQQVVQQNQQLLQAVQQQQALLQRHEGLFSGEQTAAGSTATAASTAASANSTQLPAAVHNSWLVKSVLQPSVDGSDSSAATAVQPAMPDFIRIGGEAGRTLKPQQHQQSEKQAPTNRRSQLKTALRQLLTTKGFNGLPQQQSMTGLVQLLLEQQHPGATDGTVQQQKLLAGLQVAVQALANKQHQRNRLRHSQDENALPASEGWNAGQALEQQTHRRGSKVSSAAGTKPDSRQQQQQQHRQQQQRSREKPGWSSEVFVPPPAHLLRRKISGVADAWGLSAPAKTKVRATSAASTGKPAQRSTDESTHANISSGHRTTAAGAPARQHQPHQQQRCSTTGQQRHSMAGMLQHAQWGSAEFDVAVPNAEVGASQADGCANLQAAAIAASAVRLCDMSAAQVEQVELQVEQQLQQEQQQEEENRLSRLEEASTHILGMLGRLEQKLQHLPPAAAASASNTTAVCSAAGPAVAAAAAGVLQHPLTMSSMLSVLDRIEAQEAEIRRRWFGSSEISPAQPVPGMGLALELKDGVLTVHSTNAPAAAAAAETIAVTGLQQAVAGSLAQQRQQHMSQPSAHQWQQQHHQQQQQQQQQALEVLSKQVLKSIRAGRSRFLKHQAVVDGSVEVLDSPGGHEAVSPRAVGLLGDKEHKRAKQQKMQPTYVVEAVADLLLDELLLQQVEELDGFCDALCNQLFEAEFEEP